MSTRLTTTASAGTSLSYPTSYSNATMTEWISGKNCFPTGDAVNTNPDGSTVTSSYRCSMNKGCPYTGPVRPTFTDTNLPGCYGRTVSSTTWTVQSGTYLPGSNGAVGSMATSAQVVSLACEDFMTQPFINVPYSELHTFRQSPICTSYLEWDEAHPDAMCGIGVDPPGVFNMAGFGPWGCCGPCILDAPSMSVMYFPTTTYDGCPTTTQANLFDAEFSKTGFNFPSSEWAIGARDITTSPKYAVVDGSTL